MPTVKHHTRTRREWNQRFAAWLLRATAQRLTVDEAVLLAHCTYARAFDACPEATAARLVAFHDEGAAAEAAGLAADVLIRKVSARGFRVAT